MSDSDSDSEISVGTPKLKNIKEYWRDIDNNPRKYLHFSPDLANSDLEALDESFHEYVEQRKKELLAKREADQAIGELQAGDENDQVREEQLYHNDSTLAEESWMRTTTDLSFELAEKASMMNDSTLTVGEETMAVEKMLNEIRSAKNRGASIGINDMTQLEDVEAPSMMFEATINPEETYAEMSPVKRVHMNRQSTILEESTVVESESSKNSSRNDSYVTAKQNLGNYSSDVSTVIGSETYKTAAENISFDQSKNPRRKFFDDSEGAVSFDDSKKSEASADEVESEEVIEIDSSSDDSVVIDDLDDSLPHNKLRNIEDTLIHAKRKMGTWRKGLQYDASKPLNCDDPLLVKDESLNEEALPELEFDTSDPLNCDDSLLMKDESLKEDAVPEFNDSLDRFDFLMNPENMKKMAHTANKVLPAKVSSFTPIDQNLMKKRNFNSPLSKKILFPKNANSASKSEHPTFKKPIGPTKLPLPKSAKKAFDHIKSPIGTYIKSTPQSFLSSHKRETPKNLAQDLYDKNDRDSIYSTKENFDDNLDSYKPSIPMKCGLASKHKHWTDERKHVKIPGGQKVGKILHDYAQATVVRHEGRVKTGQNPFPTMINHDDTIANSTFGNLSIQSGDVSLQVLKDARPSNF